MGSVVPRLVAGHILAALVRAAFHSKEPEPCWRMEEGLCYVQRNAESEMLGKSPPHLQRVNGTIRYMFGFSHSIQYSLNQDYNLYIYI
jgi:hypothetical protein